MNTVITHPSSSKNKIIEYTIIKLTTASKKRNLFIVSIYASHRNTTKEAFTNELSELFMKLKLQNPENKYIIAGDMNARHTEYGDKVNSQRGKYLVEWDAKYAHKYRLQIIPTEEPSFTPAQTYLDLALIDNTINVTNLKHNKLTTLAYDSDHKAMHMSIVTEENLSYIKKTAPKYLFKKTKWAKFTKQLEQNYNIRPQTNKNLTRAEIDEHIAIITKAINKTISDVVPKAEEKQIKTDNAEKQIKENNNKTITRNTEIYHEKNRKHKGRNTTGVQIIN